MKSIISLSIIIAALTAGHGFAETPADCMEDARSGICKRNMAVADGVTIQGIGGGVGAVDGPGGLLNQGQKMEGREIREADAPAVHEMNGAENNPGQTGKK
jgi:hypothetical protein